MMTLQHSLVVKQGHNIVEFLQVGPLHIQTFTPDVTQATPLVKWEAQAMASLLAQNSISHTYGTLDVTIATD